MNDEARVSSRSVKLDGAMRSFAESFGALNAFRTESCIHCGICADACHFFIATEDPKYTPILKVEPLKRAYKREASPFAPFMRMLGLKRPVSSEDLVEWQHLIYESCNLCGRCSLICPMGIDVAALIEEGRRAMADAGLVPAELQERCEYQRMSGRPEPGDSYTEKLREIGQRFGIEIPMDLDEADVLLCVPRTDVERYPEAVVALVKVMQHVGVTATFRSGALVAENYGYYAGSRKAQREISKRLIDEAIDCNASTLIVPECGHAYTALRWEAADLYGARLPFRVRHITEFLAEQLTAGNLKLGKAARESVAFHDPCQLVRKGGVLHAPRQLMSALGLELKEMKNHGGFSFCCGGGGGVYDLEGARQLRYEVQELKLREIDDTGASGFLTSCSDCRLAFADAGQHFGWDKSPRSLLELVADNLVEE
ncbi:MAG: (Fe-S)-binding protein [Pseudomonadales bacterium]|nr:(Fe-S)-binding protein [Pseudomonadales bacterium]